MREEMVQREVLQREWKQAAHQHVRLCVCMGVKKQKQEERKGRVGTSSLQIAAPIHVAVRAHEDTAIVMERLLGQVLRKEVSHIEVCRDELDTHLLVTDMITRLKVPDVEMP